MRILPLLLLLAVCFVLTDEKLQNKTAEGTPKKETRVGPGAATVAAALIGLGGQLITAPGTPPKTWLLPSGTKINAGKCWMDGGGTCPNGNCLDNNGPRGIPIAITEVSCPSFCFRSCRKKLCCEEVANWANVWDGAMNFECPQGEGISKIKSYHDNRREDRRWEFTCKTMSMTNNCYLARIANYWDEVMNFKCPNNGIITGALSLHHNHHEDRIWRYRCCDSTGAFECKHRGDINDWDAPMDWTVPDGYVLSGFYSHHSNRREDRRWNPYICKQDPNKMLVTIGSNMGSSRWKMAAKPYGYTCPFHVSRSNWAGTDTYPDTFEIHDQGALLWAKRTDHNGGWGMNLKIWCNRGQRSTKTNTGTLNNKAMEYHSKNSSVTQTNLTETVSMGSNNTDLEIKENEIGNDSG